MSNDSSESDLSPLTGNRETHKKPHRFTFQRVYPALIFAPLFYVVVRYFPPIAFFALTFLVASLAFWEFMEITLPTPSSPQALIVWIGSIGLLLAVLQWTALIIPPIVLTLLVVSLLLFFMFFPHRLGQLLSYQSAGLFGICYIGVCLGHLLLIRKLESGDLLIFFVILVTWAADIGGYYIGASIGRKPIAPRLSPKKTVEGFAAGIIFSIAFAVMCHFWFLQSFPLYDCMIIGILLACVGLLGDLSESAFKRSAGVKDSGALIPGHGGVFDRIDSLLLTAPAFYYYVLLFVDTSPL